MEKPSSAGRSIPEVAPVKHINHTPFPSQYFQTVDQYGRAFHVIATRITYDLQHLWGSGYLSYAAEQSPLAMSDVWDGEPNESSPLWESDFAPYKPKCDVLVANAVSRPPEGKPGSSWRCGIAIDWRDENGQDQHWHKELLVTGPRAHNMLGLPGTPQPTTQTRIHWQNAYGGHKDRSSGAGHNLDERNPIGHGLNKARGARAPQLEPASQPYRGQKNYSPVSLTALGRAWLPRRVLAGTYDKAWREKQWPLPPMDFDYGYWNCAPADQQIDYPTPGAKLSLIALYPPNLSHAWPERFSARLPPHQLFVFARLSPALGWPGDILVDLDTLVIDLATLQLYAAYRLVVPVPNQLPQNTTLVLETRMAPVGHMDDSVPSAELGPLG